MYLVGLYHDTCCVVIERDDMYLVGLYHDTYGVVTDGPSEVTNQEALVIPHITVVLQLGLSG